MATRYSGNVTVRLVFDDKLDAYRGSVTWPGGSFDATGLRLSPHDRGRLAVDSPEAYDKAAQAAIGFASYEHEEVYFQSEQNMRPGAGDLSTIIGRRPNKRWAQTTQRNPVRYAYCGERVHHDPSGCYYCKLAMDKGARLCRECSRPYIPIARGAPWCPTCEESIEKRRGGSSAKKNPHDDEAVSVISRHSRVRDLLSSFSVTVSAEGVRQWKRRWPCSGLPDRSVTFTFDKRRGDIEDIHPSSWGESGDGAASCALMDDALYVGRAHLKMPQSNPARTRATKYEEIDRFLGAKKQAPIGHNTIAWRSSDEGGLIHVRYHKTDIATLYPDGRASLNSGGWRTVTTKARLNQFAPPGYRVNQTNRKWTVDGPVGSREFYDGIMCGGVGVERNPHRFGRDPFARTETRRDAVGSGTCDWCGQKRATLYRYGTESDSGRFGGHAKGKFCNVSCFRSYHS